MTSTDRAAYFTPDGDTFVPTGIARGPWGQTVSGNYVGGLLAHLVERHVADAAQRDDGAADLHPSRLTVDLLRPVAMAPVAATTETVRRGRRLWLVDAELIQNGTTVARAGALYLRRGPQPPDDAWTTPVPMPPAPPHEAAPGGRTTLMWVHGNGAEVPAPSTDLAAWQHDGPKSVWLHELTPLVEGAALTPFGRAALAGDVASSLTGFGSGGLPFINADYTLSLSRLPDGPLIGLTALTHDSHDGIATGVAAVFDRRGPIGSATATALANPGFAPPDR
ncbi:thioesterase family protein [Mycobacterium sp. PS03-16]|uniref:acyl-CoA thioesterase domain-containing protein n=1 Tax=Mycobacterium sp. PS03-16 TaxID=2559611 RepID=UPI001073DC9F|nr:acyl-CoA thioesterase domain-containing protein [Mycobacterium sp. PS03-16]TFV55224.1 thioesterase family protein [Mycobacterium sp. PS03-16]